jgi:hypothetical protein
MTNPLKLPIGVQDFPTLRTEGYLYVDKTQHLYNMITGGKVYFLSRPRRFGKSLLLSTIESLFKGQRELFKNTWVEASDYDWKVHPVIRIDMAKNAKKNEPDFKAALLQNIVMIAEENGITLKSPLIDAASALNDLISQLSTNGKVKVVVLIDEYDKPILDNINNKTLANTMRDILREFYTILKAQDGNLRFVMLTGVTKFSRVSIFSGLNNLQDITMADKYATLCGYTQSELAERFDPWIHMLAESHQQTITTELADIKKWYNGYQFSRKGERVYNPFSTLLLFEQQEYRPHWFATGTPTFLITLIETERFAPADLETLEVTDSALESHDVDHMSLVALLYQTGYLTIKKYDPESRLYELTYPNFEVRETFTESLFYHLSKAPEIEQTTLLSQMIITVRNADYAAMFTTLQSFFASIPYELHQPTEKYYQSLFYLIFHLVGYRTNAEVSSNRGRMDAVLELKDRVLIFEFKLNQSAEVALKQIHDKQYYQRYQNLNKSITLFGVNFDTTQRNIVDWVSQTLT